LLVASRLRRAGLPVTILERGSRGREKVCGGCLNQRGATVLRRAGLEAVLEGAPPLSHAELRVGRRTVLLNGDFGYAISRKRLDAVLAHQIEADGTALRFNTSVRRLDAAGEVMLSSGTVLKSRTIINAAGLNGRAMTAAERPQGRIGLGAEVTDTSYDLELGSVRMIFFREGYLGLVRCSASRLIIASAIHPEMLRRRKEPFAAVDRGLLPHFDPDSLLATPRLTGSAQPAEGAIFSVGDAASYIEPVSGLGMTWALEGAEALSEVLLETSLHERPAAWRRRYRSAVGSRQIWTSIMQRTISTPARMELAAAVLSRSALPTRALRWAFSW